MEFPDENPRLPKLPFILGDLVFLAFAAFFAFSADSPPSTASIIGAVVCAGIGVALGVAPFLTEYSRAQDRRLDDRQRALEALSRSTAEATDQASIAANGLNEMAQTAKENLRRIEALPAEINAARTAALAEEQDSENAEFEKLNDTVVSLERAISAFQVTTVEQINALEEKITKLSIPPPPAPKPTPTDEESTAPVKKKNRKPRKKATPPPPVEEPLLIPDEPATETSELLMDEVQSEVPDEAKEIPAPEAVEEPEPEVEPEPAPEIDAVPDDPIEETVPETTAEVETPIEETVEPVDTSKIEDTPSPDKPSTEVAELVLAEQPEDNEAASEDAEPATEIDEPESTGETVDQAPAQSSDSETDESDPLSDSTVETGETSRSEDGTTRLTVTAYIGIGNRLFIRGDSAGLNPDEGTPLQFVSIGKWRWESNDTTGPVKATLWKNDEELCASVGEIELQPGEERETTANF